MLTPRVIEGIFGHFLTKQTLQKGKVWFRTHLSNVLEKYPGFVSIAQEAIMYTGNAASTAS